LRKSNVNQPRHLQQPAAGKDEAHLDRLVDPEYAEISGWAIFSLILAAIGAVAWLPPAIGYMPLPGDIRYKLPILVTIPLAALLLSLVAARSIRRSAGTKVGLKTAWAALAVSAICLVGSLVYHGVYQHGELQLQDSLVRTANERLQQLFARKYDLLLREMVANGRTDLASPQAQAQRKQIIEENLYGTGDYYGYVQQWVKTDHPQNPDNPEEQSEELDGVVIYRLSFAMGAVDLGLRFRYQDGQWLLIEVAPGFNPMVAIPEGSTPKKRWE
jgi:hypothetical protein